MHYDHSMTSVRALVLLASGCSLYFGNPPPPQSPPPPSPMPPTSAAVTTLANGPHDVFDIAIDDSYVYWLVNHQSAAGSEVLRVAKAGGPVETIAVIPGIVYQFAVDDAFVYLPIYVQSSDGGALQRVPKSGGSTATIADGLRYLAMVAVDDRAVYTARLASEMPVDYELVSYPLGGGSTTVLASGLDGPEALAFSPTTLYVTNEGDSHFVEIPRSGGTATQPISGLSAIHLVGDATNLYFLSNAIGDCTGGRISAWPRAGTTVQELGFSPTCEGALTVGPTAVYAAETVTGTIAAFALDGSGRRDLVTGLTAPMSIAVEPDGSALYWADFETGEIDRLAL